jgi:hypothetical protein
LLVESSPNEKCKRSANKSLTLAVTVQKTLNEKVAFLEDEGEEHTSTFSKGRSKIDKKELIKLFKAL